MIELNKRKLIILLNGLVVTQNSMAQSNPAVYPPASSFKRFADVDRLVEEVFRGQNREISFNEVEELFNELATCLEAVHNKQGGRELLNLPPSSEYIH